MQLLFAHIDQTTEEFACDLHVMSYCFFSPYWNDMVFSPPPHLYLTLPMLTSIQKAYLRLLQTFWRCLVPLPTLRAQVFV